MCIKTQHFIPSVHGKFTNFVLRGRASTPVCPLPWPWQCRNLLFNIFNEQTCLLVNLYTCPPIYLPTMLMSMSKFVLHNFDMPICLPIYLSTTYMTNVEIYFLINLNKMLKRLLQKSNCRYSYAYVGVELFLIRSICNTHTVCITRLDEIRADKKIQIYFFQ